MATQSCPFSHQLDWDLVCTVQDQQGDRVLIEHFNVDSNDLRLSLYTGAEVKWLEHPADKVPSFSNVLRENKITFDPVDQQILIVNGTKFPIRVLK